MIRWELSVSVFWNYSTSGTTPLLELLHHLKHEREYKKRTEIALEDGHQKSFMSSPREKQPSDNDVDPRVRGGFRSMLELSKRLFAKGRSCDEVLNMLMPA